jgi:hypothetical protein
MCKLSLIPSSPYPILHLMSSPNPIILPKCPSSLSIIQCEFCLYFVVLLLELMFTKILRVVWSSSVVTSMFEVRHSGCCLCTIQCKVSVAAALKTL